MKFNDIFDGSGLFFITIIAVVIGMFAHYYSRAFSSWVATISLIVVIIGIPMSIIAISSLMHDRKK